MYVPGKQIRLEHFLFVPVPVYTHAHLFFFGAIITSDTRKKTTKIFLKFPSALPSHIHGFRSK